MIVLQFLFHSINSPSGNGILYGSGEGMAQVQGASNIGRRNTHHKDAFWIRLTSTSTLQHTISMIQANTAHTYSFLTPYSGLKNP